MFDTSNKISVIIPVYKAERFLDTAIESVLIQKEVDEIILIEDGSPDNSFKLCKNWEKKHPHLLKVLTHDRIINKGAAESRNLGIIYAKNDIIGFLDVDDYYLPNRFQNALALLTSNDKADGVYEAIGTHYYDDEGKELHKKRMRQLNIKDLSDDLTTLTSSVEPNLLFETLIMGNKGWFHFNGLTLRKSAIIKTGLLDKYLWYGQDIEFFLRLSIYANLFAGNLNTPVAMRGVYAQNSTLSIYTNAERLFINQRCSAYRWKKMFFIMLNENFSMKVNRFLFNRFVDNFDDEMMNAPVNLKRKLRKLYVIILIIFRYKKAYSKVIG